MIKVSRRSVLRQGAAYALGAGLVLGDFAPAEELNATVAPAARPKARPDPYADAVFVDGAPPLPADGSYTVAVLPDTQFYTDKFPANYHAQTEWIVANAKARRIAAVLHLGDVTNHNRPDEWKVAREAMFKLDGHVPYFMVPGNHDYQRVDGKSPARTSGFSESFPPAKFKGLPTFGGVYDKEPDRTENSFHLFSLGERKMASLCLEWGPRNDVIRWANEVAAKHADREFILTTHCYVYYDETIYDWKKRGKTQTWSPHDSKIAAATEGDVNDGQELWDKLVSKHENFILTLNGHVLNDGLGRVVSKTPGGRDVQQVLVNFQMKPHGGDAWLRLLEFKADGKTIDVRDYSPSLDRMNESGQNRFTMTTAGLKTA